MPIWIKGKPMNLLVRPSVHKLERLARKEDFEGKTILHHTGGMFGIGCKVSSHAAIERIMRLKQRTDKRGMIVLVPHIEWFEEQGIHIPDRLYHLLEQYWPGNLTAAFRCEDPRYSHVAVEGKVAFRVPGDDLLRFFIELIDEPLVSTSVNISNLPPEKDLSRLTGFYKDWFDYGILPDKKSVEYDAQASTIIEFVTRGEDKNQSGKDEVKCLREGSIPFYGIKKSYELPTVLFVCTANICRSPMAEKLFNHYMLSEEMEIAGDSCGLLPGGESISAGSLQLLLEKGIMDAKDHVSKQFTPDLLQSSRLILTMEQRQRDVLRRNEPELTDKIKTLNEYLGEPGDIDDPYGSSIDTYRKTFEIIDDRIRRLIETLRKQTGSRQNRQE